MALVQYNGLNVLTCGTPKGSTIRIYPGVNEITSEELSLIEKHPGVLSRIKKGLFKIIDDGRSADRKTEAEMLEMIPRIFDKKLLSKIIKTDGRNDVVDAAKEQFDVIRAKRPDEKKKDEDGNEHFS